LDCGGIYQNHSAFVAVDSIDKFVVDLGNGVDDGTTDPDKRKF
jgi:hypothetical protein